MKLILGSAIAVGLFGCWPCLAVAEVSLTDVTEESGVTFVHRSGFDGSYLIPEIIGPGCAVLDYDGDGILDLYLVDGGSLLDESVPGRSALYRGRGGLRFEDVTEAARIEPGGYGQGCAVGDYDGDGDLDLYETNVGPNRLLRNEGDGTFRDVSVLAGVDDAGWAASASFADLDVDGDLDLFVVNYCHWSEGAQTPCRTPAGDLDYCDPAIFEAATDVLFRNRGDGTFEDATQEVGISFGAGHGLGVVVADWDENGRPDLFVANDGDANSLWMNGPDGFTDDGLFSGTAFNAEGNTEASMGTAVTDVEGDGDWDILVTHLTGETNTLYVHESDGFFRDATDEYGLAGPSRPFTGFGAGFFDADLDGDDDLFVANGAVRKDGRAFPSAWPYEERNQVFERKPDGFREVAGGLAEEAPAISRGAAFGDLDGDGDLDVVVSNAGTAPRILRNDSTPGGGGMSVRLLQEGANPEGIGAVVSMGVGERYFRSRVARDGSFASASDAAVIWPRPSVPCRVGVRWPEGAEEVWSFAAPPPLVELERGTGTPGTVGDRGAIAFAAPTPRPAAVSGDLVPVSGVPDLPNLEHVDRRVANRVRDARINVIADPSASRAWRDYGVALFADASSDSLARLALAEAARLDSADARSTYLLSRIAHYRGDAADERRQLDRTCGRDPTYVTARLRIGFLELAEGNLDAAESHFRMAIEIREDDADGWEGLGRTLRRRGELSEAVEALRRAVALEESSRSARYGLAQALRESGRIAEAERALELAEGLPARELPDPWIQEISDGRGGDSTLLMSASQAQRAGDLVRAEKLYAEYVRRRPGDPIGWLNHAAALRDLGNAEGAMVAVGRSLELDDGQAKAWAIRGSLLAAEGRTPQAIECFERALERNAHLAPAWADLGRLQEREGDSEEADRAWSRYLDLRPGDAAAYLSRAELRLRERRFDEAREDLEAVARIEPAHPVAHYRLAGLALQAGNAQLSESHFRAALEARTEWGEAYFGLGLALSRQGRIEEAIVAVRRSVELKPEVGRFREVLAQLESQSEG